MNDFIAGLYDPWFNYELYKPLLDGVYNGYDFQKIGISLIVISIIGLFLFYKPWDPIQKPRFKWFTTLVIIGIITAITIYSIIINNGEILQLLGNYSGDIGEANPQYFIFQMSIITILYSLVVSFILSIPVKFISVSNKNNPF
ncbi:hypothetical protein [Formosa algae]|uniref:hypothetical protein n=1 Tax=Formosa algae TaxID=225843 RepID=UPI000CCEFEA4|nr:hypothetical protein [Formosa algae]PNW28033.1 hypothetical protein BKP44_10285 [Formosa algae]